MIPAMTQEQWTGFLIAGGRVTLSEWIVLTEEDRDKAVQAGEELRMNSIGNIGRATQDLVYSLHLIGDKEDLEDHLSAQFFEEFRDSRETVSKQKRTSRWE